MYKLPFYLKLKVNKKRNDVSFFFEQWAPCALKQQTKKYLRSLRKAKTKVIFLMAVPLRPYPFPPPPWAYNGSRKSLNKFWKKIHVFFAASLTLRNDLMKSTVVYEYVHIEIDNLKTMYIFSVCFHN